MTIHLHIRLAAVGLTLFLFSAIYAQKADPSKTKKAQKPATEQTAIIERPIEKGSIDEINFIENLSRKRKVSAQDFLMLYTLQKGNNFESYEASRNTLLKKGYISENDLKNAQEDFRIGNICRIIVKEKKLNDSLLYNITGLTRYAYTAVAAEGIIPYGRSPRSVLTGEELIEINRLAFEKAEEDFAEVNDEAFENNTEAEK